MRISLKIIIFMSENKQPPYRDISTCRDMRYTEDAGILPYCDEWHIGIRASSCCIKVTIILGYMEKSDEDIVEKSFVMRSYGKGELASMYIAGVQQQTAVKQFNEWVRTAPGLERQLQETGLTPTARRYTPAQVRLIVGVLGTP